MEYTEIQQMLVNVLNALDTISVRGRQDVAAMAGCMTVLNMIVTNITESKEEAESPDITM